MYNKEMKNRFIELYESGLSLQKIAKRFNISTSPVYLAIKKNGIIRNRSESHQGQRPKIQFRKGYIPWNKDKKMNIPSWNVGLFKDGGGRSNLSYHKFCREVLIRDKFTCQQCLEVETNIVVHHIKDFHNYPDLRFDVNNGQTLCRSCHCKVHNPAKKEKICVS